MLRIFRVEVVFFVLSLSLLVSCDNKKNKEVVPETFVKIYDNQSFSDSYTPLDVVQTADDGFLILAGARIKESNFYGVYLMKVDKDGNFISDKLLGSEYVNPIRELVKIGEFYYFYCMDRLTLGAVLMQVDVNGNAAEISRPGAIYPLQATVDVNGNGFVLLHYDRDEKQTEVSRTSITGETRFKRSFDIGFGDFDAERAIIDHLTKRGKTLPFFCGNAGSRYYFNGFYRYNFSLVVFNMSDDHGISLVQGYKDERAISSLILNTAGTFSASRYDHGNNFILPLANIDQRTGNITSSSELGGFPMMDLVPDASVMLRRIETGGRNVLVYGSDTRGKQIMLYFYDESGGRLLGSKLLGYTNPYEIGAFTNTNEKGLVVVGNTWIAGRFSRLCLFKLSESDLSEIMSKSR